MIVLYTQSKLSYFFLTLEAQVTKMGISFYLQIVPSVLGNNTLLH